MARMGTPARGERVLAVSHESLLYGAPRSLLMLAAALRGAGCADLPDRDRIASISAPTLVLAWTGDPGHPTSTAHELGALLADCHVTIASSAADLGGWTDLVVAFLADH